MCAAIKVCPIVFRRGEAGTEVLAFRHPLAGHQFVKGTIEPGEPAHDAAIRELWEESGLRPTTPCLDLGTCRIETADAMWHVFAWCAKDLPESWDHQTADGGGLCFSFLWQPIEKPFDASWHPVFHKVHAFFVPRLASH